MENFLWFLLLTISVSFVYNAYKMEKCAWKLLDIARDLDNQRTKDERSGNE